MNRKGRITKQKLLEIEANTQKVLGGGDNKTFKPTPAMEKWLQTQSELTDSGIFPNISKIAKKANLNRWNWYSWRKNPDFLDWWDKKWWDYLRLESFKLDQVGIRMAMGNLKKGRQPDLGWWLLMQARVGHIELPKNFNFRKYLKNK